MSKDARAIYAQSSDIKSRTFLEYRHDMKKKAIAELEVMAWLESLLAETTGKTVAVEKSGGDKHVWFLRSGKITGGPDYEVIIDGKSEMYEFQYAENDDLKFFDFKVSKVGKKTKSGDREPHKDRKFIYIIKSRMEYAILTPAWIIANSTEDGVPAWGDRKACRVPRDVFVKEFSKDDALKDIIESINKKNLLLEFQSDLYDAESDRFSRRLQNIVDEDREFSVIPKTLSGFYESCFLMDKLNRIPVNRNLWIVYLASYLKENMNSQELFQFVFSLDYLYSSIESLEKNELESVVTSIKKTSEVLAKHSKADYRASSHLSRNDEVRNYLFSINLYEDIVQDIIANHKSDTYDPGFKPITKIFQSIPDLNKVFSIVSEA